VRKTRPASNPAQTGIPQTMKVRTVDDRKHPPPFPERTASFNGSRFPRHRAKFQSRRESSAVWFAPTPKILFNPRDAGAMTNETFSGCSLRPAGKWW
jgi:hypothetical protein